MKMLPYAHMRILGRLREHGSGIWVFIGIGLVALIFVWATSWLYSSSELTFTSPDETANYFFIERIASGQSLVYPETGNQIAQDLIHPRSVLVRDHALLPGSFTGIVVLYGLIGKLLGMDVVLELSPLVSAIGGVFLYLLLKRIFTRSVALTSALIYFTLPPVWMYSSRGMFHNVLFLSLVIIGLYYLVTLRGNTEKRYWSPVGLGAGFFLGLALSVRTSEAFWVGGVAGAILFATRQQFSWRSSIGVVLGAILALLPFFVLNATLFDSPFITAYTPNLGEASTEMTTIAAAKQWVSLILPFGVNLSQSFTMAWRYLVAIFPWFSIFLLMGLLYLAKSWVWPPLQRYLRIGEYPRNVLSGPQRVYMLFFIFTSLWLILYYGSYTFVEHPNKELAILGSSYLRYWLPIYVFGTPLVVLGVQQTLLVVKKHGLRRFATAVLTGLVIFLSMMITLRDPLYGVGALRKSAEAQLHLKREVLQRMEPNAVIISGNADKVFFPDRKVILSVALENPQQRQALTNLMSTTPVYYFFNPLDEDARSTRESFGIGGIKLYEVFSNADGQTVYRLRQY